ncbi:helix-turn-helix domain-containing protein [Streptomyces durbertensis]|uniref:Helix-turn-helix domain-containing protein n=2 Tax=Streptomyces durbertensis TaxID=2448886 RepID=A0ABR6EJJ5_9ACTN|nr:helix-turn-helix domain-containing protein [Streptomyces durbertensis]
MACEKGVNSESSLQRVSRWYRTGELASLLGVDASTVRRWRTARPPVGPPFVKMSERVFLYSETDVQRWLGSRRTVPGQGAA